MRAGANPAPGLLVDLLQVGQTLVIAGRHDWSADQRRRAHWARDFGAQLDGRFPGQDGG
jgi:hypothetical protein